MTEQSVSKPRPTSAGRRARFRAGAVIAVALVAAVVVWLALRDKNESSSQASSNVTSVSVDDLANLATSVDHPVFWLGSKGGYTYELTRTSNGSIFVRYLPPGVPLGAKQAYLTVATYPFTNAFAAIQTVAEKSGTESIPLANGGLAEVAKQDKASVHAAYPGIDLQIEVFDPTPGNAKAFVEAGQLSAFGSLKPTSSTTPSSSSTAATGFSRAGLKTFATSVGHPVYWAGPKAGVTYEVTRTQSGQIFVRYLPKGVEVGTKEPYLSVATYPFTGALAAIQAVSKQAGQTTIQMQDGGLAVYNRKDPKSIHLAFPDADYQVEVFDTSPAKARRLVTSGRITAIG